jgi:hypothetical protein
MTSRRKFIKDCSALVGSTALVPGEILGRSPPLPAADLATIPYHSLAMLIGTPFTARSPRGEVDLKLIQACLRSNRPVSEPGQARWEAFSLFFRGDIQSALDQGTYTFAQGRLGIFEMFIVPVERPVDGGCCYEAAFHRPLPARDPGGSQLALHFDPDPLAST